MNDGNASTTFSMTSNAGAITFSDKIDGQNAGKALLNVNTTGTTTFGGAVGGLINLASLVTDAGGTTRINGGAITTAGTQTYNDPVTLGANTTLTNSTVIFVNTVDATTKGVETLTITGASTFSGLVGNTKELGALSISDISTFNSTATSVKTDNTGGGSGNQTYTKTVTLNDGNASTTFTMTSNAGAITFTDTIDGQNAGKALLNVNTSGTTTFGGAIGGSKSLASLVTDTGGTTRIIGGAITTTGNQTYNDAVTLGANTTLTNSSVTFVNTVDATTQGAERLTINGAATFSSLVGNTKELGELTINDIITFNNTATSVKTDNTGGGSGNQTYSKAVTLNDDNTPTTFTMTSNAGAITFTDKIAGQHAGRATLNVNSKGTTTFSGSVGESKSLASLVTDTGGTTKINGGAIITTNIQTYNDAVTLGANTTLTSPTVNFLNTVNASIKGAETLTITGAATFSGLVGNTKELGELTINDASTFNSTATSVNTDNAGGGSGNQTYTKTVTLNDGTASTTFTMTSNVGAIKFTDKIDGQTEGKARLIVNSSGTTTFGGAIGGSKSLASLVTDTGGATSISGGAITTTGTQTYNDAITLGANTTLTTPTVTFLNTVDASTQGAETLTITGAATFNGLVGNTKELGELTIKDVSTFNKTATSVNTYKTGASSGDQTYTKAVTLNDGNASTTFTMTSNAGAITFSDKIDGQTAGKTLLNVNTSGTTTFGGAVGKSVNLARLVTDSGGTSRIHGGAITTTETQTYGDAVSLGANATLTGSTLQFNSTLESATGTNKSLIITGNGIFGDGTGTDTVGATDKLQSLTVSKTTLVANSAPSIQTTGLQTYSNAITLNDGNSATASFSFISDTGDITFSKTINGQNSGMAALYVNTSGTTTFGGAVGDSTSLASLVTNTGGTTRINGSTITTTGSQTYNDAIILGANTTLTSPTVTFSNRVDATNKGTETLTIKGAARFSDLVGTTTALGALSINDVSTFNKTATSVNTYKAGASSGDQTYSKAVTLNDGNASTTFTMTSNLGAITFTDKIDGQTAGKALLNVNTSGTTTFGGAIGGSKSLASLVTDAEGTTMIHGGEITTTGVQTYNDAVWLGADTTLRGNTLQFNSTLESASGTTKSLIIAGNAAFGDGIGIDTVGATDKLQSLTVSGTTLIANSTPNIKTTGLQKYSNAITLNDGNSATASFSFISDTGDITFSKTINGQNAGLAALTVNTSGTTTFDGAVGDSTSLASLVTDTEGTTRINGGTITTTGSQTYNDAITLGANTTLTSPTVTFSNKVNATNKGTETLTIKGAARFSDLVGNTTALGALSINDVSTFDKTATSVNTYKAGESSGDQTYTKTVTLNDGNASTLFTMTSNLGAITFTDKIDGQTAGKTLLNVNTSGTTTFGGAMGGSVNLASLVTDAGGTTMIHGGAITTTGNQTYGDAVSLGADTKLTGNTVQFNSTLESASGTTKSLIINGNGIFGDGTSTDTVGATDKLQSLTVSGTTLIANSAPNIKTTGLQTYSNAITLNDGNSAASFSFISDTGDITFSKTINGQNAGLAALNINTSGTTTFGGAVGDSNTLASLVTDTWGTTKINGGRITTTGSQTYNDAITLGANTTLTSPTVTFSHTVDASSKGAETLTIKGAARFSNLVGNGTELGALSITDVSTFNKTATSVNTYKAGASSGDQTYSKAVTLNDGNASTTFTMTSNLGAITFTDKIDGQTGGQARLNVNTSGTTTFKGAIGGSKSLASLVTDAGGTTMIHGGEITTTGVQTYNDAVWLGADTTLRGNTLQFNSTLESASGATKSLIIEGNAAFGDGTGIDTVGATDKLQSLHVKGTTLVANSVSTINTFDFQTYEKAITLNDVANSVPSIKTFGLKSHNNAIRLNNANNATAFFSFTSNTGDITFNDTINGQNPGMAALNINTKGSTTFNGTVGKLVKLGSLTTDTEGSTRINTSAIETTDSQTFNDSITLLASTTLTSNSITFSKTVNADIQGNETLKIIGSTTFNDLVGTLQALGELNIDGATTFNKSATSVKTDDSKGNSGNQTYSKAVTLNDDKTSTTFTMTSNAGNIRFTDTIDGQNAGRATLHVNTKGTTTFGGIIGGSQTLANLVTDADGTTIISGDAINTMGTQNFKDPVTLMSSTTLAGATINFGNTVNASSQGKEKLIINGAAIFNNAIGNHIPLGALKISDASTFNSLATSVNTDNTGGGSGDQTYGKTVTLNDDNTVTRFNFTSNAGDITFKAIENQKEGMAAVKISTGGQKVDLENVGQSRSIHSITVDMQKNPKGTLTLAGVFNTNSDVDFSNTTNISLASAISIDTHASGATGDAGKVIFAVNGRVDGGYGLTIDTWTDAGGQMGEIHLPAMGSKIPLGKLEIDGGTVTLNGNIFTNQRSVSFHQNHTTGELQKVKVGDVFSCVTTNCQETGKQPVLRIATNGGDITFNKIVATPGPDQNYLNVELLAGQPNEPLQTIIPLLPEERLKELDSKFKQVNGGKINGELDVWNAILTGSQGTLYGQIHKTYQHFLHFDIRGKAAAQTLYAFPMIDQNYRFSLNGHPIPGVGSPQDPDPAYQNLGRGATDYIPNKTENKEWMLDSAKNPALHNLMETWSKKEPHYNQKVHAINNQHESGNKSVESFYDAMKNHIRHHAIIIGVGKNEPFFNESLNEDPIKSANHIQKIFAKTGYNTVSLITNNYDLNSQPEWNTVIKTINGFSKAVQKRAKERINNEIVEQQNLIIYFVGHGIKHNHRGFWLLQDAGIHSMNNIVSLQQIKTALNGPSNVNQHNIKSQAILIIESCYPGDMSPMPADPENKNHPVHSANSSISDTLMSLTPSFPFSSLAGSKGYTNEQVNETADNQKNPNDETLSQLEVDETPDNQKNPKDETLSQLNTAANKETGTYFSQFLAKTLTQQVIDSKKVDTSRIHKLIKERFTGWIELDTTKYYTNFLNDFIENEPQYGPIEKQLNPPTNDPFTFEEKEKQKPKIQPDK
ncbi:MAG: hypothetical protein H7839_01925 [Magnetococcus sp. YQC-5]